MSGDMVSRGVFEQVMWERDVTINQLKELGYGLGEKIRTDGDTISRQAALECFTWTNDKADIWNRIKELPPVTPQPKTGHWIVDSATSSQIGIHGKKTFNYDVHCDKCRWKWAYTTDKKDSIPSNYCPNCGAKMVEPQERSK